MAVLVTKALAPGVGVDMSLLNVIDLFNYDNYTLSTAGATDQLKLFDAGQATSAFTQFTGTGFAAIIDSFGDIANITAGTVKTVTLRENSVDAIKLTGATASAAALYDAAEIGDTKTFLSLLLAGNDSITGTQYADVLFGIGGDDTMDGGAGNDTLEGGDGDDTIKGGSGNDKLLGGDDLNTLNGGTGNDTLTSGRHADVFRYDSLNFDKDRIVKWQNGLDKIDLVGAGFNFADFTLTQDGSNAVLTLISDTSNTITFVGKSMALIDAADFI